MMIFWEWLVEGVKIFDKLKGRTSPGSEKLRSLFIDHQPLQILMDEILKYVIAASGIKVENSSLASQVLTFMRRLTDTVRTIDKDLSGSHIPFQIALRGTRPKTAQPTPGAIWYSGEGIHTCT